ncbi:MAG: hypothetical protein ACFCVE_13120 [Phycisphaerae bacterium]
MPRELANLYTAISGSGYRRYIEDFYSDASGTRVVNMQIRYWIEAVEKFNNLPESEYDIDTLEEGILIVNLLANSLLTLGGVNWRGSGQVPPLLRLYDGTPFKLKQDRADLYAKLEALNDLYNKLSKHFSLERAVIFPELTFNRLRELYDATADIWLYVCNVHQGTQEFDGLFRKPSNFVKRGYYPGVGGTI